MTTHMQTNPVNPRKLGWILCVFLLSATAVNVALAERLSLSGLKTQIDSLDARLTDCEQGIGGACPGSPGPQGEQGPQGEPGPQGPPGPAADAEPPLPPVIGWADIEGFEGNSMTLGGAFDIRRLAFGISNTSNMQQQGGAGVGRARLERIEITVDDQPATRDLFIATLTEAHITEAILTLPGDGDPKAGGFGLTLELMSPILSSVRSEPASRSGESGLVVIAISVESLKVITPGFESMFNAKENVSEVCPLMEGTSYFYPVNAPGGSQGLPLKGYEIQASNSFDPVIGAGSGAAMLSPVGVTTGYFNELACLFGAVAKGTQTTIQIRDFLTAGDEIRIELENAVATKFALESGNSGVITVDAEFQPRVLTWAIKTTGGTGFGTPEGYDFQAGDEVK